MEQGIVDVDGSISSISGSVTSISGSVTSIAGSVSTISGSVNNTAGSVAAIAGTAGTAYNLTSTYGSVVFTQGSVANIAGTAGTAYNLTSTYGSVSSHVSATTSVHGITDTANLVYTNNATLGSVGSIAGSVTAINSSLGSVAGTVSMGGLVFTNEAARDAAITSPTEGMRVYLTAPTIPAATGDVTAVPTGITTIYNGSAWVCVTPVSAYTVASGQTTSFSSWTPTLTGTPGANPSITLSTGTTALISTSCLMSTSLGNNPVAMSVAVSGTTTLTPSDAWRIYTANANTQTYGATFVITGLTAGSNTFTLNYRVIGATGAQLTVQDRRITVQGLA